MDEVIVYLNIIQKNDINDDIINQLFETNKKLYKLSLCNSNVIGNTIPNNHLIELYLINTNINKDSVKNILSKSKYLRIFDCTSKYCNDNDNIINLIKEFCNERNDLNLLHGGIGFKYQGNMSKYYQV